MFLGAQQIRLAPAESAFVEMFGLRPGTLAWTQS